MKPDAKVPLSQELLRFPFTEEQWLYIAGAVAQTLSMEGPGYHGITFSRSLGRSSARSISVTVRPVIRTSFSILPNNSPKKTFTG